MPLYDFKCPKCDHKQSKVQKFSAPPPICEKCETGTERQISPANFQFKGGGYYETDFKNK